MDIIKSSVLQNLTDAGCDAETADMINWMLCDGKTHEALDKLSEHRRLLLSLLHDEQRKLACLDYLIYIVKKSQEDK